MFNFDDNLSFEITLLKTSNYSQDFSIALNENHVVVNKGQVVSNSFILVKEGDNFVNKTGIKLLETGNFKIGNSEISSARENFGCNIITHIGTKIINSDAENYYNIIVE